MTALATRPVGISPATAEHTPVTSSLPGGQAAFPHPTQAARAVVMVRPHRFAPAVDASPDNHYMSRPLASDSQIARQAYREVTKLAEQLTQRGVLVHLFDDRGSTTPDSVFPNNWFTTHDDGSLTVYPMRAAHRRNERRTDILDALGADYTVTALRDYSGFEARAHYLEGTGAMVLDHGQRIAYVARSERASDLVLERFCADHGYRAQVFDAVDPLGRPIYHTNVMMSLGTELALVALDAIPDMRERYALVHALDESGRRIVPLTQGQVAAFAGNAIELDGGRHRITVMSARGIASLHGWQRRAIEETTELLPAEVSTIEHAGGSARCMIAGVHLPPKAPAAA